MLYCSSSTCKVQMEHSDSCFNSLTPKLISKKVVNSNTKQWRLISHIFYAHFQLAKSKIMFKSWYQYVITNSLHYFCKSSNFGKYLMHRLLYCHVKTHLVETDTSITLSCIRLLKTTLLLSTIRNFSCHLF